MKSAWQLQESVKEWRIHYIENTIEFAMLRNENRVWIKGELFSKETLNTLKNYGYNYEYKPQADGEIGYLISWE
jgi:hypothetical protein